MRAEGQKSSTSLAKRIRINTLACVSIHSFPNFSVLATNSNLMFDILVVFVLVGSSPQPGFEAKTFILYN